jgi:hypothetical protein
MVVMVVVVVAVTAAVRLVEPWLELRLQLR